MAFKDVFKSNSEPNEPKSVAYNAPRAITAAAVKINLKDPIELEVIRNRRRSGVWQEEAWQYFNCIGEVGSAFSLVGWIMSRIKIYPAYINDLNDVPVPIENAINVSDEDKELALKSLSFLATSKGGVSEMLRLLALNLGVAGECYLVQEPTPLGSGALERWSIKSVHAVVTKNNKVYLKNSSDDSQNTLVELPAGSFIGRIWRTHPQYSDEAHSSMMGVIDLCRELIRQSQMSDTNVMARMNAGILYIPDEVSVAADIPEGPSDDPLIDTLPEVDDDSLEEELLDSLIAPIKDPSSASAVAPLILRGPAEYADKVVHIKLDRPYDQSLNTRADRVLDRILQGIDLPKDITTGLANVRYANGVQIEESFYKMYIQPLALLICDALTSVYHRVRLQSYGITGDDLYKHVIWYDASEITTAPDKSEAANFGYTSGILSEAAWRRAAGFSDTDAPSAMEMAQRLARERGPISEEVSEALLKTLIPDILRQVREQNIAESSAPLPDSLRQAIGDDTPQPVTEQPIKETPEDGAPASAS